MFRVMGIIVLFYAIIKIDPSMHMVAEGVYTISNGCRMAPPELDRNRTVQFFCAMALFVWRKPR
jgi:hypothetical protein